MKPYILNKKHLNAENLNEKLRKITYLEKPIFILGMSDKPIIVSLKRQR